jgi:hypothetical protein
MKMRNMARLRNAERFNRASGYGSHDGVTVAGRILLLGGTAMIRRDWVMRRLKEASLVK